jgi:hypothetical protein
MLRIILTLALLGGTLLPAHADILIRDVNWQLALQVAKKKRNYHDIRQWLFPPTDKAKIRARAMVRLGNRGNSDEAAVLLKYVFVARLRKIGSKKEGVWTVPFHLEEKRITIFKKLSEKVVSLPINRVALNAYLKRMYRAGYWPDAFRVKVMVEPRTGESFTGRIMEKDLPVIWNTSDGYEKKNGEAK